MKTGLAPLADGGSLAYTLRGEGPPLVLISGLGGLASFWNAFAEVCAVAGTITPVPGGVGPMTIAMLMANTVIAAHRAAGQTPPQF